MTDAKLRPAELVTPLSWGAESSATLSGGCRLSPPRRGGGTCLPKPWLKRHKSKLPKLLEGLQDKAVLSSSGHGEVRGHMFPELSAPQLKSTALFGRLGLLLPFKEGGAASFRPQSRNAGCVAVVYARGGSRSVAPEPAPGFRCGCTAARAPPTLLRPHELLSDGFRLLPKGCSGRTPSALDKAARRSCRHPAPNYGWALYSAPARRLPRIQSWASAGGVSQGA